MNAGPGHPSLRADVAVALAALLVRVPHTEIGRWLGVAGTTITRRGEDLRSWPSDDLLRLAAHSADVATALYLCGSGIETDTPEPVRVVGELLAQVEAGGELMREIAAALRDNRVNAAEARRLRQLITARHRDERTLLGDLAAIEGGKS
jgi:hypothetical protein